MSDGDDEVDRNSHLFLSVNSTHQLLNTDEDHQKKLNSVWSYNRNTEQQEISENIRASNPNDITRFSSAIDGRKSLQERLTIEGFAVVKSIDSEELKRASTSVMIPEQDLSQMKEKERRDKQYTQTRRLRWWQLFVLLRAFVTNCLLSFLEDDINENIRIA